MVTLSKSKIVNYKVTTQKSEHSVERHIWNEAKQQEEVYYIDPDRNSFLLSYNHFHFIRNSDGSLWEDGNLYLLYKIELHPDLSSDRMEQISNALREFKTFCDERGLDYRKAEFKWEAPTYLFKEHLQNTRTPKTVERLMPMIASFYEWLIKEQQLTFAIPLWQEKEFAIPTQKYMITGTTKDINKDRKSGTKNCVGEGYITDGEELRPLETDEQIALDEALSQIGNPEYNLIFYTALDTGARKQTILTLRLHHFIDSVPESNSQTDISKWLRTIDFPDDLEEKPIRVGKRTGADSKRGLFDTYPLYIHGWLYKRIITYIISKRAFTRRSKALPQNNNLDQYVFLTHHGIPMYHAKNDVTYHSVKNLNDGNCLDQFISRTLKPKLRENGYAFSFHFHDLRATYGANYIEKHLSAVADNELSWGTVVEQLQLRMNHSNLDTTWRYQKNRQLKKIKSKIQIEYEHEIMLRITKVLDATS